MPPAKLTQGPSLGYLGSTWLQRGPAYRRKRAVLLLGALFSAVYSVPWVVGIPIATFPDSPIGGVATGLLAVGYLYWGLLAPSSIVGLLLNLRRELPVETAARAQLTETEDTPEDAPVDVAEDPAEGAEESSRSL